MKEKLNSIGRKVLSKLLVVLGFSTTFVFMACYGPAPKYAPVDFEPLDSTEVDSALADSTVVDTEQDHP